MSDPNRPSRKGKEKVPYPYYEEDDESSATRRAAQLAIRPPGTLRIPGTEIENPDQDQGARGTAPVVSQPRGRPMGQQPGDAPGSSSSTTNQPPSQSQSQSHPRRRRSDRRTRYGAAYTPVSPGYHAGSGRRRERQQEHHPYLRPIETGLQIRDTAPAFPMGQQSAGVGSTSRQVAVPVLQQGQQYNPMDQHQAAVPAGMDLRLPQPQHQHPAGPQHHPQPQQPGQHQHPPGPQHHPQPPPPGTHPVGQHGEAPAAQLGYHGFLPAPQAHPAPGAAANLIPDYVRWCSYCGLFPRVYNGVVCQRCADTLGLPAASQGRF